MRNPVKHLRKSFFEKTVKSFQPFTVFDKSSILDISQGSEYATNNNAYYVFSSSREYQDFGKLEQLLS